MHILRHTFPILLLAIIVTSPVLSAPKAATTLPGTENWKTGFSEQRSLHHVEVLASDSLAGRYSGFIGCDKADRYIISHFEKLGLEGPVKGGYRHSFKYGAGEYEMPCSLVFNCNDGEIDTAYMWKDFNIFKYSGYGKVEGRLVFAGYGISKPDKGWDDYANLDVNGAVVMVMRGAPKIPGIAWKEERASGYKSTTALSKGAVGFILVDSEIPKYATISEKYFRAELPAVWLSSAIADSLLIETGKTKAEWVEHIKKNPVPVGRELSVNVEMQVSGKYYPKRKTCNILAVLPGSDPELSREAILIGAHMDHHGIDAAGNIYPGADDNATGIATVMELAEIISRLSERPKRSIMFAGFAAEEEGLVGSRKLVEYMAKLDYQVVATFNMDMVGQGDGSIGVGGINEFPFLGNIMFSDWPDSSLEPLEFWGLWDGSDHASFRDAGIPAYTVAARGEHPNYHTPCDTAGAIKPEIMRTVGEMVYHCTMALANHPEPLEPEVGKAKWLWHSSGGVEFASSLEGRISPSIYTEYKYPYTQLRDLRYPAPIALYNAGNVYPENNEDDSILHNFEGARHFSEEKHIPFMADSIREDYESGDFTGTTIFLYQENLPETSDAIKSLSRLGLSFVQLSNPENSERQEELSKKCLEAGIGAMVRECPPEMITQISEIWEGKLICLYYLKDFNWEMLEELTRSNCFILLLGDRSYRLEGRQGFVSRDLKDPIGSRSLKKLSSQLKMKRRDSAENIAKYLENHNNHKIGLMGDESLVQALLDAGVEEDDIRDLLRENLRRQLREWWMEK